MKSSESPSPETTKRKGGKSPSNGLSNFGDQGTEALLAVNVAWAGVTFVVSSSIVVTGNILHWSEYRGRCEESEIR